MVRRCRAARGRAAAQWAPFGRFQLPAARGDDRSARRRRQPLLNARINLRRAPPRPQVTASHAHKKRLAADKKMMNNVTKRGTIGDPSQEVCTAAAARQSVLFARRRRTA